MPRPLWLPDLLDVHGDWEIVVKRLYAVFDRDLNEHELLFRGCPVWWDTGREAPEDYDAGFWHIITRGDRPEDRLFDPRRAERLAWIRPIVEHSDDPAVKTWDYPERRGRNRTYLWLEEWDYVVILEFSDRLDVGPVYYLVTAYYVEYNSKRRDLRSRYASRL